MFLLSCSLSQAGIVKKAPGEPKHQNSGPVEVQQTSDHHLIEKAKKAKCRDADTEEEQPLVYAISLHDYYLYELYIYMPYHRIHF